MTMKIFEEKKCLEFDPFDGDFGSPGDRVLRNKIVTAKKSRRCHLCQQQIEVGERIRCQVCIFDGTLEHYEWCSNCCHAMAVAEEDDGKGYEHQIKTGADARAYKADMARKEDE